MTDTNVFEWCWEYGPTDETDRATLMTLAFKSVGESPRVHPHWMTGTDPYSVGRLMTAGFVTFDNRDMGLAFPAYETWREAQE